MRADSRGLLLSSALAALLLGTGCTSTHSNREPGSATYATTDAARVQLIPWAPNRPYERLGEIIIEPARTATWQEVDLSLREAAADMGAHAMFVVWDPTKRFSVVQVDPLASDQKPHYPPTGIVAIAIRFK